MSGLREERCQRGVISTLDRVDEARGRGRGRPRSASGRQLPGATCPEGVPDARDHHGPGPPRGLPGPTSADESPRPPSSAAGPLTHLLLRLHFYVGVLVGPFLLIAAVSGALYALAPAAEQVVYRDQLTATSPAQVVPLADQMATAGTRHTDLPVTGVVPGADGATTRVLFGDPSLPSSSFSRVVFVDPATGEIRGDTVQYGAGQSLSLRTWISELHRSLHLGEPGRMYSELAASWLAPLAVGGLVLWWVRRRRSRAPMLRSGGPVEGRARTRTRHAVAGTWAVVGLLFLATTGLSWSQYAGANIGDLRTAMNWSTPALSTGAPAGGSTSRTIRWRPSSPTGGSVATWAACSGCPTNWPWPRSRWCWSGSSCAGTPCGGPVGRARGGHPREGRCSSWSGAGRWRPRSRRWWRRRSAGLRRCSESACSGSWCWMRS